MSRSAGRPGRRNNAPIAPPRRRETSLPDVLFCLASGGWTIAGILFVATFTNHDLTPGHAGAILARLFAAVLAAAALFTFLVGVLLLPEGRDREGHVLTPMLVGTIAGAIESVLILEPAGFWMLAPLVLVVFALRPVRRQLSRLTRQGAPRR